MNSGILFILSVIGLAAIITLRAYKSPSGAIDYFKTKEGKGVLIGIVLFVLVGVVVVGASSAFADERKGTWGAYTEIFLGVDYTNGLSPQCHPGGYDELATSNGGFRQNIYLSADRRFHANLKYTHHSCAFNPDRESYDAIGVELTYRLPFDLLYIFR